MPASFNNFIITYICSFSLDEPYIEVMRAASRIPFGILIYITGSCTSKVRQKIKNVPNLICTGFLDEESYISKLRNSDCIIVLTNRDDCLVCGAYEAVALKKPLILSNSSILKDYFKDGAVYTKNNYIDIASAIIFVYNNVQLLKKRVKRTHNNIESSWYEYVDTLNTLLGNKS